MSVLQDRVKDLEATATKALDRLSVLREDLESALNRIEALEGGVSSLSDQGNADRDRINQLMALPPTHHETFKRGAKHGLETAILRVRRYMAGHFSEATIGGVVRAIQAGEDPGLPLVDLGLDRRITDHAFRFSSPDRRHCSYRKNHRGSPCGAPRWDHTYTQAQPEGPIQPVENSD